MSMKKITILGLTFLAFVADASAQVLKASSTPQIWGNVIYCESWDGLGEWGDDYLEESERPYGLYRFAPVAPSYTYPKYTDLRLKANGGGFYREGKFCFMKFSGVVFTTPVYYEFDTNSRTFTDGKTVDGRLTATDLAYDHTTGHVYGIFRTGETGKYAIGWSDFDLSKDSITRVELAPADTNYLALSVNRSGKLYAISAEASLYTIDKVTGKQSLVGPTGIKPDTYNTSMCFDLSNDTLYFACTLSNGNSALYTVNTTTGHATKVMDFRDGEQIVGMYMESNQPIINSLRETTVNTTAGHLLENLQAKYGTNDYDTIHTLKVVGSIDGKDLKTLRQLTGGAVPDGTDVLEEMYDGNTYPYDIMMLPQQAPTAEDNTHNVLSDLDLSDATLSTNSDTIYYSDALYYYQLKDSTMLPNYMFANCPRLRNLQLPQQNITSAGFFALASNDSLQTVDLPMDYKSYGNYLLFNDNSVAVNSVKFGPNTRNIGRLAFQGVNNIESVVIPDNVTSLGIYAFSECDSLKSITFGTGLGCIPGDVCWKDEKLTDITIPEGVDSIWGGAFEFCYALKDVTLPSTMIYVGSGAFAHDTELDSVTCLATTPPNLDLILWDDSTFADINPNATLYVPAGTKAAYEASDWHNFFKTIKEIGVTDGINAITRDDTEANIDRNASVFTVDGRCLGTVGNMPADYRGLAIIRSTNETARKVLIK